MITLDKVLVVIEPGNEQQPALDKVLHLAKKVEFDLLLVACDYTQYLVEGYYFDAIDIPRLRQEYLAERKQSLEALAEPLRKQGLNVETLALWAHPGYEAIVREAVRFGADLVVHHARRHGALSRMFLSNDDWQLVRCCPMPLLLAKDRLWKEHPAVMVAVDPMHGRAKPQGLDHKLVEVGQIVAPIMDGDLFVMHSYSELPLSGKYLKQAKAEHESAFQTFLEDFDIPESQQHLLAEAPEFALRQLETDLSLDLVIMGAISRNIISDIFIGSTTEKVLDYLESDILVIKPDDFVSPVVQD